MPTSAGAVQAPPLGRDTEMAALRQALAEAGAGRGQTWLLRGPGGIGKTRLLRWLEAEARSQGFQVRSGTCLKESLAPFFLFDQVFRDDLAGGAPTPRGAPEGPSGTEKAPLPTLLLLEEPRADRFWQRLDALEPTAELLMVTRSRPETVRTQHPNLRSSSRLLWLTRLEGAEHVAPGDLDRLGHVLEQAMTQHAGTVVAFEGLEYLVSQNAFPPVLRFIQFLRDAAEASGSHVVVALNPGSLEPREVSLLESESTVERFAETERSAPSSASRAMEPPATRLLRYLTSLEKLSEERPQLLVLDDLQWADGQSASAFQFLARNLPTLRVLCVGGQREEAREEMMGGGKFAEALDELARAQLLHPLPLRGLEVGPALELAARVLGVPSVEPAEPAAFDQLVHRTEGNPYFLQEIVRQFDEHGLVRHAEDRTILDVRTGGERGSSFVLPRGLRRLVALRIESLSAEERSLLECASMAGSEFDVEPVCSVLGLSAEKVEDLLDRLARQHRVIEPGERPDTWVVAHPMVWEVTLAELDRATRRRLAGLLADWWVQHRPADKETLARLFHELPEDPRGRAWVVAAAQEAITKHAGESAATYLEWLREMRRGSRGAVDAMVAEEVELARRLEPVGQVAAATRALEEMLKIELTPTTRAGVLAALCWFDRHGSAPETERHLREFFDLEKAHPEAVSDARRARVLLAQSIARETPEHFSEVLESLGKVLQLAEGAENAHEIEVTSLFERSFIFSALGQLPESRTALEEGLARARRYELPLQIIVGSNTRGALRYSEGDLRGAAADFEEFSEGARRLGNVDGYIFGLCNGSMMYFLMGDLVTAERRARQALDLGLKFAAGRPVATGHLTLATILLVAGRSAESVREATRAMEVIATLAHHDHADWGRVVLACAEGRHGADLTKTVATLAELEGKLQHVEPEQPFLLHLHAAQFDAELGRGERAREQLAAARSVLEIRSNPFLGSLFQETEALLLEREGKGREAAEARDQAASLRAAAQQKWGFAPAGR